MERNAFVLRIAPSGIDQVPEALESNQIIIGWSDVSELVDPALDWNRFREILHNRCYADEANFRKSGNAAGHMWRFVREMQVDDLVVVPYGPNFYVAQIVGPAIYLGKKDDDTAYRRNVEWLTPARFHGRTLI